MQPADVPARTSTLALEEYTAEKPALSSAQSPWSTLLVRTYVEPDVFRVSLPAVPDPLIIVQYSGADSKLERNMAGKTLRTRVGRGSVWFIPAEENSQWHWQNQASEKIASVHLHLSRGQLWKVAEEAAEADAGRVQLLDRFPATDPLIENIALSLKRELETGNPGGKLYADAAGQMLVVQLLRHHATLPHRVKEYKGGLPPYRLRQVIEYMHAHLGDDFTLDTLAGLSGMSTYHFARLFKQSTGESPYRYVIRLRMEKAKQLLRETSLTASAIAYQLGYHHPGQFFQAFGQYTGATPLQYRLGGPAGTSPERT
jgi:AraC family transcriptional regulator